MVNVNLKANTNTGGRYGWRDFLKKNCKKYPKVTKYIYLDIKNQHWDEGKVNFLN